MEASVHALRRGVLSTFAQSGRCACRASLTYPSRSPSLRKATQPASSFRPFSSSSKQWLEEVSESDIKVSNSSTHPSSPVQASQKQALQSYISSIQTIINGYQLGKKENLHERLHSNLMVALSNAEARLNAPNAASESFEPLLKSLQGEVGPVLKSRFATTDISKIVGDISRESAGKPSEPAEQPVRPNPQPPTSRGVAQALDAAYAGVPRTATGAPTDAQKLQNLGSLLIGDTEPRKGAGHNIRSAFSTPGNMSGALFAADRTYDELRNAQAKGPTLRLTSSLGKSVDVTGSTDLTRAFQRMEMVCARNGVRRDLARQRFHIRRGQLKKQMRMERWRRLFREGFIAECGRVRRMRRQGW